MSVLKPTEVSSIDDVRRFFDTFASYNIEQHGNASSLLNYRVSLLKKHADLKYSDDVLDIGCGNGHHLFALDGYMRSAIGVDLAPGMVEAAIKSQPTRSESKYRFFVDDAQTLSNIPDGSVDVVFCVGALEHMFDKLAVLNAVKRVLRKDGRFVCLTLNDRFVWYRKLAPYLGYATQHLSTDVRLDEHEAQMLLQKAGFRFSYQDYWTFIPRGDMPRRYAGLCRLFDAIGRAGFAHHLRGGLVLSAVK